MIWHLSSIFRLIVLLLLDFANLWFRYRFELSTTGIFHFWSFKVNLMVFLASTVDQFSIHILWMNIFSSIPFNLSCAWQVIWFDQFLFIVVCLIAPQQCIRLLDVWSGVTAMISVSQNVLPIFGHVARFRVHRCNKSNESISVKLDNTFNKYTLSKTVISL
jgi:hypothetical protein